MRPKLMLAILPLLLLVPAAAAGRLPDPAGLLQRRGKSSAAKKETYAVVQTGKEEPKVVPSSQVAALRKKLQQDYAEAKRKYDAERKKARRAKQKFKDPKPVRPKLRVLADKLPTEEAANKVLAKHQKKGSGSTKRSGKYAVIQTEDGLSVASASQLAGLKKAQDAEYKRDLDAWNKEKRAAAKQKQKFVKPKPKKAELKVLRSGFDSREKAQEYLAQAEAKKAGGAEGSAKKKKK